MEVNPELVELLSQVSLNVVLLIQILRLWTAYLDLQNRYLEAQQANIALLSKIIEEQTELFKTQAQIQQIRQTQPMNQVPMGTFTS
jgi:hypothetical protein